MDIVHNSVGAAKALADRNVRATLLCAKLWPGRQLTPSVPRGDNGATGDTRHVHRPFDCAVHPAGRAELRLDGEVADTLDLYGPGRGLPFEWRRTGLAPGKHSLRMTVTGEKPAASTDHYINIIGLDVNE